MNNFSQSIQERFNKEANSIYNENVEKNYICGDCKMLDVGGGRYVYDISGLVGENCVLKIPFNKYGRTENRYSTLTWKQSNKTVRDILAPNVGFSDDWLWIVQKKVDTNLTNDEYKIAKKRLNSIASDNFNNSDISEIYKQNIGNYNGNFVLVDYGWVR